MMYQSTDHGSDVNILSHAGFVSVLEIKHLKDKKLCSLRSSRIRMTSYPCNKYQQIMPSYLLSVKVGREDHS